MNSTTHEEAICDKAADSLHDGMVDSSSFFFQCIECDGRQIVLQNAFGSKMSLEDLNNCIEMYHRLRLAAKPSSSMPKYFMIDPAYPDSD